MTLPTPRNSEEERFLSHVKESAAPSGSNLQTPCWVWTASCSGGNNGRPQFNQRLANGGQKNTNAARWAYMHFKHQPASGAYLCHMCDNPMCVNPDHLWEGDANDNTQDCIAKSRHATAQVLSKLDKAVSLKERGMSSDDIARALNVDPCEVERLLDFHDEDARVYDAEKEVHGEEVAKSLRSSRLTNSYGAVVSAMELMSLARHIRQLDLGV